MANYIRKRITHGKIISLSLVAAYKFYEKSDSGSSRKLFRYSLIQLPILMILFFVNKKEWISRKETSNKVAAPTTATTANVNVL